MSNISQGLTGAAAKDLLDKEGYNELPSARPRNIGKIALEVIREPMFLLLIGCGTVYTILGDYREGMVMLLTIFIIIFITFFQYRKTERALEALRNLSSPRALVIRDGREIRIPGREVVRGDLLVLHEGDRVAADAHLLESAGLMADESLLTGESVAVGKKPGEGGMEERVFSGTMIVQGDGIARVYATGTGTEFGKIGISLQGIGEAETRLQAEMKKLIGKLFVAGILISVGVVGAFYLTRGHFLQALLNGLAASMAILPEEFPVVLTVFLALGAWRLSRIRVLVRKPSAIENLGAATVLCSDKTGTITQNRMQVVMLYNGERIYGEGRFPEGDDNLSFLVRSAYHASRADPFDPMEIAIAESHKRMYSGPASGKLIKEYPFSRDTMAMTRVLQEEDSSFSVFAKGAPETIFRLCRLSAAETAKHQAAAAQMASGGIRVIAVASSSYGEGALPDAQHGFDFTFTGLIGLADPVRPEVPGAIAECQAAGVRVIMITGDYPVTAKSIAAKIGLPATGQLVTGEELDRMDDANLRGKIGTVTVFARVVPEQKLRIVEALKANGETVAMTGDGVNDAPALKAANIGVAMGNKGTDVAREAAALVLLDDNFVSIVSAIRSGRRIYDNLQKAMSYILAIHIPIIGLALLPAFLPALPVLLMPLHIVFMEMVIDPVCSVAFETEQEEWGIMNRPPRKKEEDFFGFRRIIGSLMSGLLLLGMVMLVYFVSIREGHTDPEVRAITFSALIIGNIFLILTNLSKTRTVLSVIREWNFTILGILLVAGVMLLLILFVPFLQELFSLSFPGYSHFIISLAGALGMVTLLEIIKLIRNRSTVKAGNRPSLPHRKKRKR